jgi:hypothetical protein
MEEEYTGTYALVHPDLADDPAKSRARSVSLRMPNPNRTIFMSASARNSPRYIQPTRCLSCKNIRIFMLTR